MTGQMPQLHDVADTFDEAMAAVKESLIDARRQLAAWSLTNYPNRGTLDQQAHELRKTLGSAAVEINAISRDAQITIAGAPRVDEPRIIPVRHSLCVISAAAGKPMAIDDIPNDPVVACHPVQGHWFSWASAPITVNRCVAGTVCALEKDHSRQWDTDDQAALEDMAARIGRMVDIWAGA